MNPAVFLDRDNTLIHNDGDLGDPALVRLIQGSASAIASLRGLGYKIVVITNQGGVARGKYTEADVEAVHNRINDLVRTTSATLIDRFYFCPYHPEGKVAKYAKEHSWRKPAPGMLLQAAKDMDLDLGQSWMIGDQMRDIEAGNAAGVRTILLRSDAEELTPLRLEQIASAHVERSTGGASVAPNFTARSLIEAVRVIAQQRKPEPPEEMRARERTARKWDAGSARAARQGQVSTGGVAQKDPETPTPAQATAAAMTEDAKPQAANQEPVIPAAAPRTLISAPVSPPAPAPEAIPFVPAPPPLPEPTLGCALVARSPLRRSGREAAMTQPLEASPPHQEPAADEPGHLHHATLHQILLELRDQRSFVGDFTWLRLFAMMLQIVVIVCMAGALAMGQGKHQQISLRGWMDTAIVMQLATIAALMFEK